MKFLIFLSIFLSLIILFLEHPMSLGFILLIQTITTSLIINMINLNFWFSYILFLIMIGGMLILFIYMTSVASNEKFNFSNKIMVLLSIWMILMILIISIDNLPFNLNFFNLESMLLNKQIIFSLNMSKFFNFPNLFLFYITIIYLLITLIAVVKISDLKSGSLRQSN